MGERLATVLEPFARPFDGAPLGPVLRERVVGHAAHPGIVHLPVGLWLAAQALDLAGRADDEDAALLQGFGVLLTVPSVATGLAEWNRTRGRERRLGAIHAAANTVGVTCHAGAWLARRSGRRRTAVSLTALGNLVAGASAYVGGHLATVRHVGSAWGSDGASDDASEYGRENGSGSASARPSGSASGGPVRADLHPL